MAVIKQLRPMAAITHSAQTELGEDGLILLWPGVHIQISCSTTERSQSRKLKPKP